MLLKTAYNNGYKEGHKAGAKEVVDWISNHHVKIIDEYGGYNAFECCDEWIEKLKEWGVK